MNNNIAYGMTIEARRKRVKIKIESLKSNLERTGLTFQEYTAKLLPNSKLFCPFCETFKKKAGKFTADIACNSCIKGGAVDQLNLF
jgi:hypothetical protein